MGLVFGETSKNFENGNLSAYQKDFPELESRLAKSFPWKKEPSRMILFEALSMALQVRDQDIV